MSKSTRIWKKISTIITVFALLLVLGAFLNNEYSGAFFGAVTWIILVFLWNVYLGSLIRVKAGEDRAK